MSDPILQSQSADVSAPVHPLTAQYCASHSQSILFEQTIQNIISEYKLIRVETPLVNNHSESERILEQYRDQFSFYSNQLFAEKQQKQQILQEQNTSKLIAVNQFIERVRDKHSQFLLKKKAYFRTLHRFEEVIEQMKIINAKRQSIEDEVLRKEEEVAKMIEKLSEGEFDQIEKVKNLEVEIENLSESYIKESTENVNIKCQLTYMRQYLNYETKTNLLSELESIHKASKTNETTTAQLNMLENKLLKVKENFNPSQTLVKLEQNLNMINEANKALQDQNDKLLSLITELNSVPKNDNQKEGGVIQFCLSYNGDQMNTKAKEIQSELSRLDDSLRCFVEMLSSFGGKGRENNSIDDQVKKAIEANVSKNSYLNNLNAEIASLNKKLIKLNNNSNKMKMKEKKLSLRRKNDQLKELEMEKDNRISELQMMIDNQKHRRMMKQIGSKREEQFNALKEQNKDKTIEIPDVEFDKNDKREHSGDRNGGKSYKKINKKRNNK